MIGFGYIGESQLSTIISSNNAKFFKIFYLIAAFIGGITVLDSIWDVTDFFLALIMVINLIVILLKSKEIFDISNDYWKQNGE